MPKGLLLVMMEPPADMEAEFNDWYDTEHLPQRLALPGFENGSRWVCLSGWPRWVALYDMASVAALDTPEYLAVSGDRSTPWSRRILPAAIGRRRIVAEQIHPGDALAPKVGDVSRLVVAHFPRPAEDAVDTLRKTAEEVSCNLRLFRDIDGGLWSIAAFPHPVTLDEAAAPMGVATNGGAKVLNLYAPYARLF